MAFLDAAEEGAGLLEEADAPESKGRKTYNVNSSAITRVEYDADSETAYITFAKAPSGPYTLEGVSEIEIERLVNAESPGAYWNANMRGKY